MRILRPLLSLGVSAAFVASGLVASDAVAMAPATWTAPKRIPGTFGMVNPVSATAPDGTDLVTWLVDGPGAFGNAVTGKVRLAGSGQWKALPLGPDGPFLGVSSVAATPSGDFWVTYGTGAGDYKSYVVKLDSQTRKWSKPIRLFKGPSDYNYTSPQIAMTAAGTLVVAAAAPLKEQPGGDPVYRVAVTIKKPGGTWKGRFVSPEGKFAGGADLAVNAAGDIVISFIQGYDLADMTVRAATKAHGKKAAWKVRTLSVAGDSQRAHSAIGADGTAAVVWGAPSSGTNAARMSTIDVRRKLAPWVGRDVVTSASVDLGNVWPTVTKNGEVTVLWRQSTGGGTTAIWTRHLVGNTLTEAVQLTPDGEIAEFDGLVQRPDGKASLLYQRFTPAIDSLGMEVRVLNHGAAGPVVTLTGDEAADGDANSEYLGTNAASQPIVIYTRGTYPDTDYAWLSTQPTKPAVVTNPQSGKAVKHAKVKGSAHVGDTVSCESGYWVEAAKVTYSWISGGDVVRGEKAKRYKIRAANVGDSLRCRVTARNSTPHDRILTSSPRHVG